MRILFIGDIVAKPGREAVGKVLADAKSELNVDFVVANAENVAHGRGITQTTIMELMDYGVDYFTGGDHIFWHRDTEDFIDDIPLVRPANYPALETPGVGYATISVNDKTLLLINVLGRVSFGGPQVYLDDPFRTVDTILANSSDTDITLIDFHGDATSEKYAFAFYFDGRVDAIIGTHTHVPTSDTRVLPNGTLYVTDAGMTGNIDSVLGVKTDIIQKSMLTAQNQRFEWEKEGTQAFRSVLIDTENKTIERFDKTLD